MENGRLFYGFSQEIETKSMLTMLFKLSRIRNRKEIVSASGLIY